MPPKRVRAPKFMWAKRGGCLIPHTRGIVFGMHLLGAPATEIAERYLNVGVQQGPLHLWTLLDLVFLWSYHRAMHLPPPPCPGHELLRDGDRVLNPCRGRAHHASGRRSVPCSADHRRPQRTSRGPATTLLAVDPKTIIFTDESIFSCSDTKLRQWVAKGEDPKPRRKASWSARAYVWGRWR